MNYNKTSLRNKCYEANITYQTYEIISLILDRVENPNDYDDIIQAVDDELIYYKDQRTILKEYCNPVEANWNYAIESFIQDIETIIQELMEEDVCLEQENSM